MKNTSSQFWFFQCTWTKNAHFALGMFRVVITSSRVPLNDTPHRFDGIHNEVEHHLLQLNPIAENRIIVIRNRDWIITLFLFASTITKV